MTEPEFWNDAYLSQPDYTMVPDHLIRGEVADLEPRHAIDLGCGNGANAFLLASIGWTVTGIDWADHAVFLAERAAYDAGVTARFEIGDSAVWNGNGLFDLVISTFALPAGGKAVSVVRNAQRLLAPGGTLLVTEWDRSMSSVWDFSSCELHDPNAIVEALTELEILTSEVRRVEQMFEPDDPRAAHGQWANVAVVKAVRAPNDR